MTDLKLITLDSFVKMLDKTNSQYEGIIADKFVNLALEQKVDDDQKENQEGVAVLREMAGLHFLL